MVYEVGLESEKMFDTLSKYICLVFLILLKSSLIHAQDYDGVKWEEENKLSWEDFKGKAPLSSRAAAITASGVTYRYSASRTGDNIEVDFKVSSFFYPQKSWYKPSVCDSIILGHEQLHFDISELFARKLKKRLEAEEYSKNIKAEVRKIYKEVVKELDDFQNLYDQETNFSRNIEKQIAWESKIASELSSKKP